MSINRNVLIPILSAVGGVLLGGIVATRYWVSQGSAFGQLANISSANEHIRSLRQIRSGKSDPLLGQLEDLLDSEIIGLSVAAGDIAMPKHEEARTTLRKAAAYRKEFPHSSSIPELDQAVANALTFATP